LKPLAPRWSRGQALGGAKSRHSRASGSPGPLFVSPLARGRFSGVLDSRFHGNDRRDGMSHPYALSKSASSRQLWNPPPCRRGLFSSQGNLSSPSHHGTLAALAFGARGKSPNGASRLSLRVMRLWRRRGTGATGLGGPLWQKSEAAKALI